MPTPISDFDFTLPKESIAQTPASPRDTSRLFVISKETNQQSHTIFKNLPTILKPGDTIVRNNTKVFNARLFAETETKRPIEIFLLRNIRAMEWEALLGPTKAAKRAQTLRVQHSSIPVTIKACDQDGVCQIVFQTTQQKFKTYLNNYGTTPLPPYITTQTPTTPQDYQTTYAKREGSVAAPTAGLHFTNTLDTALKNNGINIVEITLHVGIGTFRPIRSKHIEDHHMHREYFEIHQNAWRQIQETKKKGGRIIAVGTTTARLLESLALNPPKFTTSDRIQGSTNIYITPGFSWQLTDGLITNFHLPKSSLIILVSSLLGTQRTIRIYKEAIAKNYRFYSFGDAMLIL